MSTSKNERKKPLERVISLIGQVLKIIVHIKVNSDNNILKRIHGKQSYTYLYDVKDGGHIIPRQLQHNKYKTNIVQLLFWKVLY